MTDDSRDEPGEIGSCCFRGVAAAIVAEPEGAVVPTGLRVYDAHVHIFPPRLNAAIWRWFDRHAWNIRYRLEAEQVVDFLRGRGVARMTALHYAHKPGLATYLNRFAADVARAHDCVAALGTVLPGEPGAVEVLREALGPLGLRGVKLHCHVQQMPADDPRVFEVYRECESAGVPVVIHSGREPSLSAYGVDTRELCGAGQVERALRAFPRLRMVVPHLGADEFESYAALLDRHENLYLDTTMVLGELFSVSPPSSLFPGRAARLLYGTDFPNIPYAWDYELRRAARAGLDGPTARAFFYENAARLFG